MDDIHFMVRVVLDEQGREIISDCLVYTVNDLKVKEMLYDDLSGMEYKDMELDREQRKVYITYLDGGKEKIKEYEMMIK